MSSDRLAIATFNDSSAVVQAMSDVSAVDMGALKTRVSNLTASGGTSLIAVRVTNTHNTHTQPTDTLTHTRACIHSPQQYKSQVIY